jgi:alkanesulfonate monooxygenase SsuD/methylene tetrahydromethanopterin reductase-like flavin-dependent oxidoreductase (luciferase family)
MPETPFAAGSISLRLYPHLDLPAPEIVSVMRDQARRAAACGFDGVMVSEHHGGFAGYLPNPIQACNFLLDAMASGWAAPSPLLLPLRPAALVIEELAWLAARFPGRVGVGLASGSLEQDFTVMGLTKDGLTQRFADSLEIVAAALGGLELPEQVAVLAGDPAVAACRQSPVPMVSAAMSNAAVRRAAEHGMGLLLDSLTASERCAEMVAKFREYGGTGPVILIRRVWMGEGVGVRQDKQVDVYRSYSSTAAQSRWGSNQTQILRGDVDEVVAGLREALTATGADALNLRLHVPGVTPKEIEQQTEALAPVLEQLHGAGH